MLVAKYSARSSAANRDGAWYDGVRGGCDADTLVPAATAAGGLCVRAVAGARRRSPGTAHDPRPRRPRASVGRPRHPSPRRVRLLRLLLLPASLLSVRVLLSALSALLRAGLPARRRVSRHGCLSGRRGGLCRRGVCRDR